MRDAHPQAGKIVRLHTNDAPDANYNLDGAEYRIEDYWQNVAGMSWMVAQGNPACLIYAMRAGFNGLPIDNEVVYGKVGGLGHLVHTSELGEELG